MFTIRNLVIGIVVLIVILSIYAFFQGSGVVLRQVGTGAETTEKAELDQADLLATVEALRALIETSTPDLQATIEAMQAETETPTPIPTVTPTQVDNSQATIEALQAELEANKPNLQATVEALQRQLEAAQSSDNSASSESTIQAQLGEITRRLEQTPTPNAVNRPAQSKPDSSWLVEQSFTKPTCDPHSYSGWQETEFFPTGGGETKSLDMTAESGQTVVIWGSNVTIEGKDYGRALVVLEGATRQRVVIRDGAYRKGYDNWNLFPEYIEKILTCLYGGNWKPQSATNQVATEPTFLINETNIPSGTEMQIHVGLNEMHIITSGEICVLGDCYKNGVGTGKTRGTLTAMLSKTKAFDVDFTGVVPFFNWHGGWSNVDQETADGLIDYWVSVMQKPQNCDTGCELLNLVIIEDGELVSAEEISR